MSHGKYLAICVAGCGIFISQPAYAYIDPGTGSMVLQTVIAGIAAGFTTVAFYWSRIVGWFRGDKPADTENEND